MLCLNVTGQTAKQWDYQYFVLYGHSHSKENTSDIWMGQRSTFSWTFCNVPLVVRKYDGFIKRCRGTWCSVRCLTLEIPPSLWFVVKGSQTLVQTMKQKCLLLFIESKRTHLRAREYIQDQVLNSFTLILTATVPRGRLDDGCYWTTKKIYFLTWKPAGLHCVQMELLGRITNLRPLKIMLVLIHICIHKPFW